MYKLCVPNSLETIQLASESRNFNGENKVSFDYTKLNKLYDDFVSQKVKSKEHFFSRNDPYQNCLLSEEEFPRIDFSKKTFNIEEHLGLTQTNTPVSEGMQAFKMLKAKIDLLHRIIDGNLVVTSDIFRLWVDYEVYTIVKEQLAPMLRFWKLAFSILKKT